MEKLQLVIEILKLLMRTNSSLTTSQIHKLLCKEGYFTSHNDKVERRKLLRALNTLVESGYVESLKENRKVKKWRLVSERFRFLSSYTRQELVSLIVLLSFFPSHYRELPFFKTAFETISRFEKELSEEERELLRFSFERIPNLNERCVTVEQELITKVISAILENRGAYLYYTRKGYKVFPVKFFTYNGLFYLGALTEGGYRNFLLSRIRYFEPLSETIPLSEKKKRVRRTFEIPNEEPFLFGVIFPSSYATDKEVERGIKFSPFQFFIAKEKAGIKVYLVGFTGKRFASWFLTEKIEALLEPTQEMIELAKRLKLKESLPELSYSLKTNRERFKRFREKSLEILERRFAVFEKNR